MLYSMTTTWRDTGQPAPVPTWLATLHDSPCPDRLLDSLCTLPAADVATVLTRTSPWARTPAPIRSLATVHGCTTRHTLAAARALHGIAVTTGTPAGAVLMLARPAPGGVLADLSLDHRAMLTVYAPTRGWVQAWDLGHAPVPAMHPTSTPPQAAPAGERTDPATALACR